MELFPFVHEAPATRVVFGPGRLADVPDEVTRLGAERVLLIGDTHAQPLVDRLTDGIGPRVAATFDDVVSHVPVEIARDVTDLARSCNADLLLSVGGGSTVGTAKAVALELGTPILAVPTTYAGSEMTPMWGLTEDGRKLVGRDPRVRPKSVVYDPELTVSLPAELTAHSGMNAMAHLVEGLYAPVVSPLSISLAQEGIRALLVALPDVIVDPDDLEGRGIAFYGAWLAGWTMGTRLMGVHHRICHVLGGMFATPHAQTHSAVLPYATIFNAPDADPAMRRIKRAFTDGNRPAPRSGVGVWELAQEIGAATTLESLGVPESGLDEVAARVADDPPPNPRRLTRQNVRRLLQAAWEGGRPVDIPG